MTKQNVAIINYNFGEKVVEKIKDGNQWVELTVWQAPKFKQSREKAIQLIEKDYGLDEGDFWILMNKSFKGMTYSGLIISHNGCLKINDKLETKMQFRPSAVSFLKDSGGEKVMQYICDEQGIYEFGEIAPTNCKNQYPYAMVLKRLMDRVILKASKIGYFGIYSENESDSFKKNDEEPEVGQLVTTNHKQLANIADGLGEDMGELVQKAKLEKQRNKLHNANEFLKKIKIELEAASSVEKINEICERNKTLLASLEENYKDLFEVFKDCKEGMIQILEEKPND